MLKYLFIILFLLFLPEITLAHSFFKLDRNIVIVINKNASLEASFSAIELQYFLRKVTSRHIPIVNKLVKGKKGIFVGKSDYTQKLGKMNTPLLEQEYLVEITPDRVTLLGSDEGELQPNGRDNNGISPEKDQVEVNYQHATGDSHVLPKVILPSIYAPQGTCYAVYDFIEKFLGVRFYGPHPDNIVYSEKVIKELPCSFIRRGPAIKYRHGTYTYGWPIIKEQYLESSTEMQQLFIRRLRMGGLQWGANHSFTGYQDRFFKKNPQHPELFEGYHPEYFAVGRSGGSSELQFCYTNKSFIKQVAKDAINYFLKNKLSIGQVALGDYFAVVPLDNANWCTCTECLKLLKADEQNIVGEHFNCGTATHYIWTFINNVAKEVAQQCPEQKISALAYHVYAYFPENLTLEPNISVAPCLHPRNYWAPGMKENEMNLYKRWVKESKQTGRDLFLWNYLCFPTERGLVSNFNVFPGFNIHTTGNQIRMYSEDGIKGVFLCGIGEQLDYYITMKLFDDPNLDIDHLMNDFFKTYFGQASEPMKAFYSKIESVYSNTENYPENIRTAKSQFHQTREIAWKYLGTDSVMKELSGYIHEAQNADCTALERRRVESWVNGVWNYMQKGYTDYNTKK